MQNGGQSIWATFQKRNTIPFKAGELGLILSGDDLLSGDLLDLFLGVGDEDGLFFLPLFDP